MDLNDINFDDDDLSMQQETDDNKDLVQNKLAVNR